MRFLYQYSARDSFLHRLDPRTKLIFIICYLVMALVWPEWELMAFTSGFIILLLWVAGGISPKEYWVFLVYLAPIMIALLIVHSWIGGPPYFRGNFEVPLLEYTLTILISEPGFLRGLGIGLRLATMGVAFMMFSMTTDPFDISLALHKIGVSFKFSFIIGFMLRFLPLIQEELFIIGNAAKARAYSTFDSRNPINIIKGIIVSLPPLATGALRRSQDIALAMELRGFSVPVEQGIKRTYVRDISMKKKDHFVVLASVAYAVGGLFYFFTTYKQIEALPYVVGLGTFLIAPLLAYFILFLSYRRAQRKKKKEQKESEQ
ncbi:MAG: energy-coupling factor transporter transmembrane component T family protein [Candidatus Heimdallarchaeota archaeon]